MQENPVLNREVRGRWRRPLTPIALFVFAAALALVGYLGCEEVLRYNGEAHMVEPRAGRNLLVGMAMVQIILASLFATAITAPSIAAERESGTLLILRFAPVTMREIVYGKFCAAVFLVVLLIFVPLPVISLTFVLGGVSALEFCAIAFIQLASGVVCASIGLMCSAVSRTASRSLPAAFVLSMCTLPVPLGLTGALQERGFFGWCIFGLAGAGLVALFCTESAVVRMETEPAEPPVVREPDFFILPAEGLNVYGPRPGDEGYRPPVAAPPLAPADGTAALARAPRAASLLTPLGRALRFSNPVFQHQIHGHLQAIVRAPAGELQSRAIQLSALCIGWLMWWVFTFTQPAIVTPLNDVMIWMTVIGYGLVVSATTNAATAFARERSRNMLTTLLMTPLAARDVAGAKRDAAFVAALFYFLLASPFFSFAFAINPGYAAGQAAVFMALMALGSSLGVLSGWLCRSQGMAVAIALIALMVLFAAFYAALDALSQAVKYGAPELSQRPWGNFVIQTIRPGSPMESLEATLALTTVILAVSALAMLPVLWGLRPRALERDRTSWLNQDLSKMV